MPHRAKQIAMGERLRSLRIEMGLSQDTVAEQVRRTRQAVAQWELGRVAISAMQIGQLAAIYGSSTDFLIYGVKTVPVNDESLCSRCPNGGGYISRVLRGPLVEERPAN
ncbi:MAG: helix-turn-helix transcriptional regulator [Pseudomonadota bacterium]